MSCYSVGKLLVLQHLTLQSEINIGIQILSSPEMNRIGGVMVSILSSADDCGFEPQSGQTKDYKIGICCFSAKHAAFRRKGKDWLAQNQDNVSKWGDMSIRDCWSCTKRSSSSFLRKLTCSCPDIAKKNCWVGVKQQSLKHSPEMIQEK